MGDDNESRTRIINRIAQVVLLYSRTINKKFKNLLPENHCICLIIAIWNRHDLLPAMRLTITSTILANTMKNDLGCRLNVE